MGLHSLSKVLSNFSKFFESEEMYKMICGKIYQKSVVEKYFWPRQQSRFISKKLYAWLWYVNCSCAHTKLWRMWHMKVLEWNIFCFIRPTVGWKFGSIRLKTFFFFNLISESIQLQLTVQLFEYEIN